MRNAYFYVTIAAPAWYKGDTRFLSFLCSATSLPGVSIITTDERYKGHGPTIKVPHDVAHTDISLRFYSDGNGEALQFFNNWTKNIVSYGSPDKVRFGAGFGDTQYRDNYTSTIEIFGLNEASDGAEIIRYKLIDAFPTGLPEVQMDWQSTDELMSFTIPITYTTFQFYKNKGARKGNTGPAVELDSGYFDRNGNEGPFAALNNTITQRMDFAEMVTPGFIGSSEFFSALGALNKVGQTISDSLNIVNNLQSSAQSYISSRLPSIPSFSFP